MKLSARKFVKWLVKGSYYSIELDAYHLIFKSDNFKETVPFTNWNGRCYVERGICWGRLMIEVKDESETLTKIQVHGLDWMELKIFAEKLSKKYAAWIKTQKQRVSQIQPQLDDLKHRILMNQGYMRSNDLDVWKDNLNDLLNQHDLSPCLMKRVERHEFRFFDEWLTEGALKRQIHNEQWKRQQLQQWSVWFDQLEDSPLNASQREAVLLSDNHNLILAGAGSGKTSVLIARVRYLIESQQSKAENILLLAFSKKASLEMKKRFQHLGLENVRVLTFHGLAKKILEEITQKKIVISPLAMNQESKTTWLVLFLSKYFVIPTNEKRWKKHLSQWHIPGIKLKKPFIEQLHDSDLHQWMWRLISLLNQQNENYIQLKQLVKGDAQAESELNLIWPVFKKYKQTLKEQGAYDFQGLIREASKLLKRKQAQFGRQYDHIMVDEYQDISPSRLFFLQALCHVQRERGPSLFAVGDDWQAIYRFAGADVRLTSDFLSRFPDGVIGHLEMTYRFNSQIGDVANRFIQVNPKQLTKPLQSFRKTNKKAVHLIETSAIETKLEKLSANIRSEKRASVMFIGRQHKNKPSQFEHWVRQYPRLDFHYVTAHASKGLEADYVFLIDVNAGIFPAQQRQQGLEYVLLMMDEMEYAEERRLFYVALTRARHACWICSNETQLSPFIEELYAQNYPVTCRIPKHAFTQAVEAV